MFIDNQLPILNPNRFNKRPDAYQICPELDDMDTDYYIDDGIEDTEELNIRVRDNNKDIYRNYELFDEETDIENEQYSKYDEDEISPERSYALASINGAIQPVHTSIDTDYPMITLLKNGKKISIEQFLNGLGQIYNETIQEMFLNNEDLNTIGNLFYAAFLNKSDYSKYLNESLLKDGYEMLKENYPLDFVVNAMKNATKNDNRLGEIYMQGSLKYLAKFPEYQDTYITKYPNSNVKFFDQHAAELLKKLNDICNDEDTIKVIINATKIRTVKANGTQVVDKRLADIAIKMIQKNNGQWTDTETKILKSLKREDNMSLQESVHKNSYKTVLALLDLNITTEEILKVLQTIK